ncbi:fukutin-like [Varroa jacobsoni]|uniref:LicD/FKTN/FKRP nucleotidyltransferase domain-containing protein n=1 Tax=Varroa destructor TaxID=109461 RepID=A0A7M7KIV1_VARDE|nr:fukutin-like [Varroa destructor]XP_022687850.1 fukutin-like [Varroa jacobsoni]
MLLSFLRFAEWLCALTFVRSRLRALLYVTLIVCAFAIQIALIIQLLNDPPASQSQEPIKTKWSDFSVSPTWRAIRDVIDTGRLVRLPVFALQAESSSTRLDSAAASAELNKLGCMHFCTGTRFQFGTIATFSNRREPQFIEQLTAKGFEVDTVRVPNPNMVELIVELTTHFVIRCTNPVSPNKANNARTSASRRETSSSSTRVPSSHSEIVIHIVVFHDRPDHFWWHAPVPASHPLRRLLEGLPFVSVAGAHSKIEIAEGIRDGIQLLLPAQSFQASVEFIDCNRTRAEEFFEKNGGRDSSPNSELFRIRVRKLLLKVKMLLAKHSIPFWLSSGTCLGWFRQCDVIPYTTDVDIGVFIEDFRPAMIDEFSTHDLALTHVFGHPGDSYELSFLDVAEQLKLDVFFFYRESNYTWNGGTQARTGHKYKYVFSPFSMCLTEFLDLLVQVPCPTLPYILANYGGDWRRPVRHWDWKRSPPNVRENGVWPMEQWSRLIQLFPLPPY